MDFLNASRSRMRKPLSAITASPASSKFSSPLCFTISLLLIDPVHSGGMKEIAPFGYVPVFVTTPSHLLACRNLFFV